MERSKKKTKGITGLLFISIYADRSSNTQQQRRVSCARALKTFHVHDPRKGGCRISTVLNLQENTVTTSNVSKTKTQKKNNNLKQVPPFRFYSLRPRGVALRSEEAKSD